MNQRVYPWQQPTWENLFQGSGTLPHGIILAGRKGLGKLHFARQLARALLCENRREGGPGIPCGQCPSCHWLASGSHPDLRVLEPEILRKPDDVSPESGPRGSDKKPSSQIPVDDVRELHEFLQMTSHRGKNKVVLVHPADSLTVSAANALLKNLEEPPPRTVFILVAHRLAALLPTVRSRCRILTMPAPAQDVALAWLRDQGIANPELSLALAGGAPLGALAAGEEAQARRSVLLKRIAAGHFSPVQLAEELRDYTPENLVHYLHTWAIDLIYWKYSKRIVYNLDFADPIAQQAECAPERGLLRFQRQLGLWRRTVEHPLNTRLFAEQVLMSYADVMAGKA
jgi:DNA polymerase-3 subunit delta'